MAYSTSGARLFSCGVGSGAEMTLVEWNESDGAIARRYSGFKNTSGSLTRFDTAADKYLIVGDDHSIKVLAASKPFTPARSKLSDVLQEILQEQCCKRLSSAL